jgi:hypothetical protein
MPSGDPSEDPKADMNITSDYEPVDYAINDFLIEMAECAHQAPGVVLISPTHKRAEGRAPVWGSEFTSKRRRTTGGGPAETAVG